METSTDSPVGKIPGTTGADSEGTPTPRTINDVSLDAEAAMLAELDAAIASATTDELLDEDTSDNSDAATVSEPEAEENPDSDVNSVADDEAKLSSTEEEVPVLHAPLDEAETMLAEADAMANVAAMDEQLDANIPDNSDAATASGLEAEENTASDVNSVAGDNPVAGDEPEDHHREEVPALLGMTTLSGDAEAIAVPDVVIAEDTPTDARMEEDTPEDTADAGAPSEPELPDNLPPPVIADEHAEPVTAPDAGIELKLFTESLQEVLADIRTVSAKIDAVSVDTDSLINQVNSLSIKYDSLAEEIQANATDGATKSFLSKTFLTVSSLLVAALAVFQLYTFVSLIKSERKEHAAVASLLGNMNDLNKKLADYDKNLTKTLVASAQPEPAPQPHHAAPEQAPHGVAGKTDSPSAPGIPVLEKMNRLRNGLPEKKLIRKETGDWFVYNKKGEECIADVEIIDALNQAYRKSGRSISPGFPLPAHNALCLLKPDGKGGTEVIMTKNYIP